MDFVTMTNLVIAAITILFGGLGWLAPRYTMDTVGLRDTGSTMGRSEVRAASGALFVVAGLGALWLDTPAAFAMLGFIWLGGALGRVTSLFIDGQTSKKWSFFVIELAVALTALGVNLDASA